ncbi:MAG: dihydroorotase family protein [Candidatus Methanomethylicia archaeon]
MKKVDLILKGKIFLPSGLIEANIGIEEGKIAAISKLDDLIHGDKKIKLNDEEVVIPGVIDAHTHIRGMGRSDWEDFYTGSMAAAAGGVTTIFEMPITLPSTSTATALEEKIKQASKQSIVNFAFHGAGGFESIPEIPKMASIGAISFKIFMHPPPPGREDEFKGLYVEDDSQLFESLATIKETGKVAYIHAENHVLSEYFKRKQIESGGRDLIAYMKSKPSITESEAINRVSLLTSYINAKIHIAHVSSKESIEILDFLKKKGIKITAETAPHYLHFTIDQIKHLGPYAKVNPPIRFKEDRLALWNAISTGVIDIVASDHAAYPKDVKEVGEADIWKAYMGVPGIECLVPIVLDGVNKDLITFERAIEVLSTNVAKIFGLYPNKGVIAVGSDADLTIIKLKEERILRASEFYTKAREIALLYDNVKVIGIPTMTIVNGEIVMENGEVIGKSGIGRFIKV